MNAEHPDIRRARAAGVPFAAARREARRQTTETIRKIYHQVRMPDWSAVGGRPTAARGPRALPEPSAVLS